MSPELAVALTVVIVLILLALAGFLFLRHSNPPRPQQPAPQGPEYAHDLNRVQYHEQRTAGITSARGQPQRSEADDPRAKPLPRCPSCGAAVSFGDPRCHKCGRELSRAELER